MTSRIYTRTGDQGETGLFGGQRVPKDDIRVAAYGTVDELNSAIGLVLALDPPGEIVPILESIQRLLFELGAELATPSNKRKPSGGLRDEDVTALEIQIDHLEALLPELKAFILPAGTPAAAALHVSRATCRRAERAIVALSHQQDDIPVLSIVFMNRLGDLLFVLARFANHIEGVADALWAPRPKP